MNKQFQDKVIGIIARTQKIPFEQIQLHSTLEELGIDSFDGVNLLFAIEDEFNITLADDTLELKTVQHIIQGLHDFLNLKEIKSDNKREEFNT